MYKTGNIVIIIVLFFIFLLAGSGSHAGQIAVIAHKSVPVDTISAIQLLDLYTGDRRFWSDGQPATVFDLKIKGEARDTFYRFLGKKPSRMKSIWMKKMLLGEGAPPPALASEDELSQEVASTAGAVGFVSLAKVTEEVKVLTVIEENSE